MISSKDLSSSAIKAGLAFAISKETEASEVQCDNSFLSQSFAGGVFKTLLPKGRVFSRALYTFDIGQNDLTAGYFLNMTTDEVRAYVPDVLGQFKTYVKV